MSRPDLALVRSMKMLPVFLLVCACNGDNSGSNNGTGGSGGVANGGSGGGSTGGTADASSGGQPGSGGVLGTGGSGGTTVGDAGGTGGTTAGGTGGQAAGGTGGTGGTVTYKDICGCTFANAENHTGQAAVTVSFGGTLGFAYSPKCIIVNPGTDVTFSGSFGTHPLRAYTDPANTDPGNPIQATSSGSTATFTFSAVGSFGYYCSQHVSLGMCGAVYVTQ